MNPTKPYVRRIPAMLLSIFAALWALITLYPIFVALISSFKVNDEIFGAMFRFPRNWHFENYVKAMTVAKMGRAILNSTFVTAVSTALLIVISSMASYSLARSTFRFTKSIYLLFIFGILLPIHATLIPLAKMVSRMPFLKSNSFTTLILIYAAFQLPISIFIITGYMKSISRDLDDAARIDGCGPWWSFVHVIFPLSKPAVSTSAIIAFLFIYNELIFAVVFLSDQAKYTISLAMLQFVGYRQVQMGPIYASIVLAVIPMVIIYLLFQSQIQKGMTAGAVKG